ncbi:unnamed protein product [Tetraodon nigroviridis]|uniref:(spotted green pufferfish) hypothetical protein n=1 Tax=Tetraodon nigroviridis TaxID=99883 RepID=Q4SNX8_TETNG|nr:unnamed protein product [Tetraodon nigroviridis]
MAVAAGEVAAQRVNWGSWEELQGITGAARTQLPGQLGASPPALVAMLGAKDKEPHPGLGPWWGRGHWRALRCC